MSAPVASRVGTITHGVPAITDDPKGWGRFKMVTIIGKKINNVQPAIVYLNIYSATPKGAWATTQERELGEGQKAHKSLIDDIDKAITRLNSAGIGIIASGDLNCNLYDPKDYIGREWNKAMHSWGLVDIMQHDNTQYTFRKRHETTKIDYVFASRTMVQDGYVRNPQIMYEYESTMETPGLNKSLHIPIEFEVDIWGWLQIVTPTQYDKYKIHARRRTLKCVNKKQGLQYADHLIKLWNQRNLPYEQEVDAWAKEAEHKDTIPKHVQITPVGAHPTRCTARAI